jgi:beta-galactosidase
VLAIKVATTGVNAGLATCTVRVRTSVAGPGGREVDGDATPATLAPGETAVGRQRLYLRDPALWSPDSPLLHTRPGGARR